MYPKIRKRRLCPSCRIGSVWEVELPDAVWMEYWVWLEEQGFGKSRVEIAGQCDRCEVVFIYPIYEEVK